MAATTKQRGMVLQWLKNLSDDLAALETVPNHTSIVAVGAVLVTSSDPDGSKCRPGTRRVARLTGLHTSTVNTAIKWLHDSGWLTFVGRLNPYAPNEYKLTIPVRASSAHDTEPDVRASSAHDVNASFAHSDDAPCAPPCAGPCAHHPRKPPTSVGVGEEEDALRRSADAETPTAHSTNGRADLTTVRRVTALVPAQHRTIIDWTNSDLLAEIARLSEWTDDQLRVAVANGWPEKVPRPTGYLLTRRLKPLPTDPAEYAPGFGVVAVADGSFDPNEYFAPWGEDMSKYPPQLAERQRLQAWEIIDSAVDWYAREFKRDPDSMEDLELCAEAVVMIKLAQLERYRELRDLIDVEDPEVDREAIADQILADAHRRYDQKPRDAHPRWLQIVAEHIHAGDAMPLEDGGLEPGKAWSIIARFAVAVELAEAVTR